MKFNKYFICLLASATLNSGLFSAALDGNTADLFHSISKQDIEGVKKAIAQGASLTALNPITRKTALCESLHHYNKEIEKPFIKNMALSGFSALPGLMGLHHAVTSIPFLPWRMGEAWDEIGIEGEKKALKESFKTVTAILSCAVSFLAAYKYGKDAIKIKVKMNNSLLIVDYIYNEMTRQQIALDQGSLDYMKKLARELEEALTNRK